MRNYFDCKLITYFDLIYIITVEIENETTKNNGFQHATEQ